MNNSLEKSSRSEGCRVAGGLDQPLSRERPKLFVMGLRCGRLGNRLLSFAHFIALAEELGHRVLNVTFHTYAHLFESTLRDIYCRYPPAANLSWLDRVPRLAPAIRRSRMLYHVIRYTSAFNARFPLLGKTMVTVRETPAVTFIEGPEFLRSIEQSRIVFTYGWRFRAPTCVARHAQKIRDYFRPVPEIVRSSQEAIARLRPGADIVIGVHVRHGDYSYWRGGKFMFPVSRYAAWMRELATQLPGRRVSFLVCSDERRSADEFPGLTVGFGPGTPVGDMCALGACDFIFGPFSTFTQWASFYGNTPLRFVNGSDDHLLLTDFRVSNIEG